MFDSKIDILRFNREKLKPEIMVSDQISEVEYINIATKNAL